MDASIICSLIEAAGAVIAAIIGAAAAIVSVLIAQRVVKRDIRPMFQSYSDPTHNLSKLIKKAQHNIIIFTALGDGLMRKYGDDIEDKLKAGVEVRYLLLDEQHFLEAEAYMHGPDAKGSSVHAATLEMLRGLAHTYRNSFQLRTFPRQMSASYVGVDLPLDPNQQSVSPNTIIQVMQYQYMVKAGDSPITYIFPNRDTEQFNSTIVSMQKMWRDATTPSSNAPPK